MRPWAEYCGKSGMRRESGLTMVWVALLLAALLPGCAGTRLETPHPLLSDAPDPKVARVYFIRPRTERFLGVADNAIVVEADRQALVRLVKGEYTLARLRPGTVWITVRSETSWGPQHDIKAVSRSRRFEFAAGRTYFVVFNAVDGEFRGVHFEPQDIDPVQAAVVSAHLRPVGPARRAPITLPGS